MPDQNMQWCAYYRAIIKREECWFLTATLRSFEHLAFDRTYDKSISQFEFFVPQNLEHFFVQIMDEYKKIGLVSELEKLPNRLMEPGSQL